MAVAYDPDAASDPAHEASAIKPLYRADNKYIDLQLGLVNLRLVELVPCASIIAKAGSGLLVWDLGTQGSKPGDYCGVKIEIVPVAGHHRGAATEGEGGAADTEEEGIHMAGKAVLVSPCYYPDTAGSLRTPLDNQTSHSCMKRLIPAKLSAMW